MSQPIALVALSGVSGASFLAYGLETLFGAKQRTEFERYGLPGVRVAVGCAQLLGAIGVVVGLWFALVGAAAAAGLAAMMAFALVVRVRIDDAPRSMVPAASFGVLNLVLVVLFIVRL